MAAEEAPPVLFRCPGHGEAPPGVCERCGLFACASCLGAGEVRWCAACRARPEARLTPSERSTRALLLAVLGLHGVVVLLPLAAWLARVELEAIEHHQAVLAGKPYAQGALLISAGGLVLWSALLLWRVS